MYTSVYTTKTNSNIVLKAGPPKIFSRCYLEDFRKVLGIGWIDVVFYIYSVLLRNKRVGLFKFRKS